MSDVNQTNPSDNQPNQPATGSDNPASDQLELKLPDESSAPRDLGLWAGVLMLLVLVAYWPATSGKFLWGDNHVVVDNLWVRYPGGLADSWTQRWNKSAAYRFSIYQPVTASVYWLEYRLGGHADPTGPSPYPPAPTPLAFHLGNLFFHAVAAVLLWLVLRELLVPGAWVIAAIFALHPLNTEAISWIANQSWPLAGTLFFGSVLLYLHFVKQREKDAADRAAGQTGVDPVVMWGYYLGSAAVYVLAILANPAALLLPVVVLLAVWCRRRLTNQDFVLLLPWLVIGGIVWMSTASLPVRRVAPLWHADWQAQLAAIGNGFCTSILIIVPASFRTFHSADQWWLGALALVCWLGVTGLFWINRERWSRGLFTAWVAFGLLLICSLNWFDPARGSAATDSSTYLAGVPLIALVVALIVRKLKDMQLPATLPQVAVALSAALLLIFGGVSWARSHVYDNPVTFWQDAVNKDPHSSNALSWLAEELRQRAITEGSQNDTDGFKNDLATSLATAQAAVTANPQNSAAQRTWANVLVLRGDVKSAIPHFQQAVDADPNSVDLRLEFASGLDTIAMFKEAIPQADAALANDQSSAMAHHLLGTAYGGLGDETRAISELELALKLDPSNLSSLQTLAEQQGKAGKLDEAIKNYATLLQVDPARRTPDLFVAVARLRERLYQWDQAVDWFNLALKMDPGNADYKASIAADTIKAKAQAATRPTTRATTAPAVPAAAPAK